MGYFYGNTYRSGVRVVAKPPGAETSSSTHEQPAATLEFATAVVLVDVASASGTSPTLVVVVEGSGDDGATWVELGRVGANGYRVGSVGTAPANFTGAGEVVGVFPATQLVRTRSIIGGTTPSFTYSVTIEAR